MLYGAEVNILDENGSLDLEDSILAHLDYVIASIHKPVKKPGTKEENTRTYLNLSLIHISLLRRFPAYRRRELRLQLPDRLSPRSTECLCVSS